MSIGSITFHNVKTIEITPIHFEHADPTQSIKSMDLVFTDENGVRYTISAYGDLGGKNTMPDISFAPTKIIKLG